MPSESSKFVHPLLLHHWVFIPWYLHLGICTWVFVPALGYGATTFGLLLQVVIYVSPSPIVAARRPKAAQAKALRRECAGGLRDAGAQEAVGLPAAAQGDPAGLRPAGPPPLSRRYTPPRSGFREGAEAAASG